VRLATWLVSEDTPEPLENSLLTAPRTRLAPSERAVLRRNAFNPPAASVAAIHDMTGTMNGISNFLSGGFPAGPGARFLVARLFRLESIEEAGFLFRDRGRFDFWFLAQKAHPPPG